MHRKLLYGAYGWLVLSGILQFAIDVVAQHIRGKRAAGPETTLYYGLNSAYALGQIVFGVFAILVMCDGVVLLDRWPGLTLSLVAGFSWLIISFVFLEYREPRFVMAIYIALLVGAAVTAPELR